MLKCLCLFPLFVCLLGFGGYSHRIHGLLTTIGMKEREVALSFLFACLFFILKSASAQERVFAKIQEITLLLFVFLLEKQNNSEMRKQGLREGRKICVKMPQFSSLT